MANIRGLVISVPMKFEGPAVRISGALDPQELRSNLLFWDILEWPDPGFIQYGITPDAQFLIDSKIIQRTPVTVPGGQLQDILLAAYRNGFRNVDQKEPGTWSIGGIENAISIDTADLENGRGILVRLYQAIPVPDREVPLQDILEFRERRRAELIALRCHLEDIYQKVINAGDGDLGLSTEVQKLELAIADQIKASKETGFKFRPVSLNASLNLIKGVAVATGAIAIGLPTVGALMAGAGAAISIGPSTGLSWGKPTGTPFRYISAFHKEVF